MYHLLLMPNKGLYLYGWTRTILKKGFKFWSHSRIKSIIFLAFMVFDNLLAFHNVRKNHFEWLIFIYVAEMDWRTSFLLHMSPVSTTSWMLTQVMSKNNHWKSTDKNFYFMCILYIINSKSACLYKKITKSITPYCSLGSDTKLQKTCKFRVPKMHH